MCSDYIKNKETIYRYAKIIFRNRIKYLCFVFASQFFISPFKCRVWFYFFHVLSCFKNKTVDIFFCIFWISLIFYLSSAFPSPICCEHTASLSQHVWSFSSQQRSIEVSQLIRTVFSRFKFLPNLWTWSVCHHLIYRYTLICLYLWSYNIVQWKVLNILPFRPLIMYIYVL